MHTGNTKGNRLPIEVLTESEVSALVAQCSKRSPTGRRNRALILLLFRCQLRIAEALALKPVDVDEGRGVVNVRKGKGSKQRQVVIDPGTLAELGRWLAVRKGLGVTGHKPIFCTLRGGTLYASYVRTLLPRLASKAGIDKRVHPHGLRHSGASALLGKGVAIQDIQKQLGHAAPSTTDQYLHDLNPQGRRHRMAGVWDTNEADATQ